jgi:hypothetical protein
LIKKISAILAVATPVLAIQHSNKKAAVQTVEMIDLAQEEANPNY